LAFAADVAHIDAADRRLPMDAVAIGSEQSAMRIAPEQMRRATAQKAVIKAAGNTIELGAILAAERHGERTRPGEQALGIVASALDRERAVDPVDRGQLGRRRGAGEGCGDTDHAARKRRQERRGKQPTANRHY
jgi:hypothetical protein